jgi:hypothetical protein
VIASREEREVKTILNPSRIQNCHRLRRYLRLVALALVGTQVHDAVDRPRVPIEIFDAAHPGLDHAGGDTGRVCCQMKIAFGQVNKLRILGEVAGAARIRRGAAMVKDTGAGIGPIGTHVCGVKIDD